MMLNELSCWTFAVRAEMAITIHPLTAGDQNGALWGGGGGEGEARAPMPPWFLCLWEELHAGASTSRVKKIFKSVECPLTCNHLPTPIQISKLFHAKRDGVGWEIGALGWDGGWGIGGWGDRGIGVGWDGG